jgi:hypothetical protein
MSDWKSILSALAPKIATGLGGPLAGIATKFVADKWLGKPDASMDEISMAIEGATPEQLANLKKLDLDYALRIKELGLEEVKLNNENTEGARRLFNINKWPQIVLSAIYTVGYFSIFIGLLSGMLTVPPAQETTVNLLMGGLTAAQLQIMNFWFGSTSGSQDKDHKK